MRFREHYILIYLLFTHVVYKNGYLIQIQYLQLLQVGLDQVIFWLQSFLRMPKVHPSHKSFILLIDQRGLLLLRSVKKT